MICIPIDVEEEDGDDEVDEEEVLQLLVALFRWADDSVPPGETSRDVVEPEGEDVDKLAVAVELKNESE